MNLTTRIVVGAAATATLLSGNQLIPAPARADKEPRSVTYLVRLDGMAPGAQATFWINDTETSSADLGSLGFGQPFEAQAALTDLSRAGMRVTIPPPYSGNAHCEISVDGNLIARIDRFVATESGDGNPVDGVLTCGAPVTGATAAS
jgi:hypothetical protein